MANLDDFTGAPFVAGSVRGIRFFTLPTVTTSRLQSVFTTVEWCEGENLATCNYSMTANARILAKLVMGNGPGITIDSTLGPQKHAVASLDCSCGFYAFNNQPLMEIFTTHEATRSCVGGIIEGYGRVVVGSKGFRAQYAKILSLFLTRTSGYYARDIEKSSEQYYPHIKVQPNVRYALEEFPVEGVESNKDSANYGPPEPVKPWLNPDLLTLQRLQGYSHLINYPVTPISPIITNPF